MPQRDVTVPKKTDSDQALSEYVRTVLESGNLGASIDQAFADAITSGKLSHEVSTDKAALAKADSLVKAGMEVAQDTWNQAVAGDKVPTTADLALGTRILEDYLKRGDANGAVKHTAEMAAVLTNAGKVKSGVIKPTQELMNQRATFGDSKLGKGLNTANNMVSNLMEASDSRYKRQYFVQSMAGFLQARAEIKTSLASAFKQGYLDANVFSRVSIRLLALGSPAGQRLAPMFLVRTL